LLSKLKNNRFYPLILILSFAIINWIAWPVNNFVYLIFIGFIPLLLLEEHYNNSSDKRRTLKFFISVYFSFLLWNTLTTWWVCLSTLEGGIAAIVLNSLLMSIPMMLFWFTKNVTKVDKLGYVSFVFYWVTFEYFHLNWDGSWPWLSLGNVFAQDVYLVQWYSYTGILGGTIWILLLNVIFFYILTEKGILFELGTYLLALTLVPVSYSLKTYFTLEETGKDIEVVVVQPNIDPYNEKFPDGKNFIKYDLQLKRLLDLSAQKTTDKTEFLVWPETAIPSGIEENSIYEDYLIMNIMDFMKKYPNLTLIAGADTYRIHGEKKSSESSRYNKNVGYWDNYNTALSFKKDSIEVYHKSKLVPGVEKMPFAKYLGFLESMAINMGGTFGSLGTQNERTVFYSTNKLGAAPVICYESIYGDFMSEYVTNGANLVCIITNDGWWGETPGYKQHLAYGRLRAIEFRRAIARAANTGISCFINQKGQISEKTDYWVQDVRKATLKANDQITFYAHHGDYLGRTSGFLAFSLLISALVKYLTTFKKKP
jgi:apolipoprotein N-acyltransferase